MAQTLDVVHRSALEPHRDVNVSTPMLADETLAFITALSGKAPVDPSVWHEALTHGSMDEARDYQRLEFLGDRVLGLAIADWLFERRQDDEGKLSQRLNALVSREACAQIARMIGLSAHLRLGKQARDDGGADSDNILGDVLEALIGAAFIDHGFETARAMIRRLWADAVEGKIGLAKHPKSALQEWAAGSRRKPPEYRVLDISGPGHALNFTVSLSVKGVGEVEASGASKQEAETRAAKLFLEQFG